MFLKCFLQALPVVKVLGHSLQSQDEACVDCLCCLSSALLSISNPQSQWRVVSVVVPWWVVDETFCLLGMAPDDDSPDSASTALLARSNEVGPGLKRSWNLYALEEQSSAVSFKNFCSPLLLVDSCNPWHINLTWWSRSATSSHLSLKLGMVSCVPTKWCIPLKTITKGKSFTSIPMSSWAGIWQVASSMSLSLLDFFALVGSTRISGICGMDKGNSVRNAACCGMPYGTTHY